MFAGSRLLLPVYINCVTLVPETREEGGTRCQRALAAEGAAGRSGDRQWLPEAVVLEQKKNRWDGRLAAVLLGRGGVAAVREGAEESPRSPGGRSLLPSAMFGEEQGTGDSRPVSGAGVVHYQLLHRPRSVPTALGPAPLATHP